jgi:hypothetical protein
MKLTEEQFQQLFGGITQPPEVVGISEKDRLTWSQGYSFAISQLFDVLVVSGEDEDDKYFDSLVAAMKSEN